MTCRVILWNTQNVYKSGQIVTGSVLCTFQAENRIRGIRVKLRGKEVTDHIKRGKVFDNVERKWKYRDGLYKNGNKFLEIVKNLVGGGTMSIGRYEYPFSFTLPIDIPSSYEGAFAFIRYYIKANVNIPRDVDLIGQTNFHVHSPIDFNRVVSGLPMRPVGYRTEKTLGYCCWASEAITMKVYLHKEAFVKGEIAKILVDVTNMACENVVQMRVIITRTIEARSFRKQHKFRKEQIVLASAIETGVGAHGQRSYYFNLPIPTTKQVYNFTRCQNLRQWFTLSIEAVLPASRTNMEIKTNLILGHIPLGGVTELHGVYRPDAASRVSPGPPPPLNQLGVQIKIAAPNCKNLH